MFPVVSAASSHPNVDADQPTASQSTSPQQKTTEETTPSLTSLNLVSAEAESLPSTPATFSPETVRPFPNAGPRKMTNNRGKKKTFRNSHRHSSNEGTRGGTDAEKKHQSCR